MSDSVRAAHAIDPSRGLPHDYLSRLSDHPAAVERAQRTGYPPNEEIFFAECVRSLLTELGVKFDSGGVPIRSEPLPEACQFYFPREALRAWHLLCESESDLASHARRTRACLQHKLRVPGMKAKNELEHFFARVHAWRVVTVAALDRFDQLAGPDFIVVRHRAGEFAQAVTRWTNAVRRAVLPDGCFHHPLTEHWPVHEVQLHPDCRGEFWQPEFATGLFRPSGGYRDPLMRVMVLQHLADAEQPAALAALEAESAFVKEVQGRLGIPRRRLFDLVKGAWNDRCRRAVTQATTELGRAATALADDVTRTANFGPTEAEIWQGLALAERLQGKSIREIAALVDRDAAQVRSYLKTVGQKTASGRQSREHETDDPSEEVGTTWDTRKRCSDATLGRLPSRSLLRGPMPEDEDEDG